MEAQDDVLVALGNLQILDSLVSLPQVTSYYQCTLRLQLSQCLVYLGNQLIPLLVLLSHRLVHKLVGNPVIAAVLQEI